ncbi:MAG: hypothetical protein GXY83_09245 [Rhodopirellula sp.]|nr:hypothetical protein [Rhodopirellula sp.]
MSESDFLPIALLAVGVSVAVFGQFNENTQFVPLLSAWLSLGAVGEELILDCGGGITSGIASGPPDSAAGRTGCPGFFKAGSEGNGAIAKAAGNWGVKTGRVGTGCNRGWAGQLDSVTAEYVSEE